MAWQGSYGSTYDITDEISGGKLAGWLEIRDEVIPKYQAELSELASKMIWAINYQHSQGAGLEYVSGATEGTYAADDNGLLTVEDAGTVTIVEDGSETLSFPLSSGTLVAGDMFTITTDDTGLPESMDADGNHTAELMSDWLWTLDSFASEFNRNGASITATVTSENRIVMDSDDNYYALENTEYSGAGRFSEENTTITVLDDSVLDFKASDKRFVRSGGNWGILNDATGGLAQIIPEGGDDNGFKVDLDGDGIGDIEIEFSQPVYDDGYVGFDLVKKEVSDLNYSFGGDVR